MSVRHALTISVLVLSVLAFVLGAPRVWHQHGSTGLHHYHGGQRLSHVGSPQANHDSTSPADYGHHHGPYGHSHHDSHDHSHNHGGHTHGSHEYHADEHHPDHDHGHDGKHSHRHVDSHPHGTGESARIARKREAAKRHGDAFDHVHFDHDSVEVHESSTDESTDHLEHRWHAHISFAGWEWILWGSEIESSTDRTEGSSDLRN